MSIRTHSTIKIFVFLAGALAFAASQAHAAAEFTLGSSTLSVGTETDSTADGGCMNGTTNSGCDSYTFKVPITVDPSSDIGDDLTDSSSLAIGIGSSDFCSSETPPDLEVIIPHSLLMIKKTSGENTVRFSGMAEGTTPTITSEMVPVKLLIQVHRHSNKGFVMVSGLGDLSAIQGNTTAFVGLATTLDSDSDTDAACTSVRQKNKTEQ